MYVRRDYLSLKITEYRQPSFYIVYLMTVVRQTIEMVSVGPQMHKYLPHTRHLTDNTVQVSVIIQGNGVGIVGMLRLQVGNARAIVITHVEAMHEILVKYVVAKPCRFLPGIGTSV